MWNESHTVKMKNTIQDEDWCREFTISDECINLQSNEVQ